MTSSRFDRWLLGASGLVALLVVAVLSNFQNTRQLNEDAEWVAHSHEVMSTLEEANRHLLESATIQRTFLVTGGDAVPPGFATKMTDAKKKIEKAKELTFDNAQQQARITEIMRRSDELEKVWTHIMAVRMEQGFDAAKQVFDGGPSLQLMAELQGQLREAHRIEQSLLRDRSEQREETYRWSLATGLLLGVAAVAGVTAFMGLFRRHLIERIAATATISEQGERLRTTLASIGDAVIATDAEGRITTMNGVAETLTGWTKEEALGQPLDGVFHIVNEQTRQAVDNPAKRALEEGIVVGLGNHTILISRDGAERPIDDSAAPIRCKDGHLVGCVLVFRDVSQRRNTEKKNARQLQDARLLSSIVESSEDAIISKTLDGVIQSWNAAAERLFGYTSQQAVGRHITLIIPPDRIPEEDRIIASLKAGRRVEHFETVRRRGDGKDILVSLTISPIRDETGKIIGASKIARDITRHRQFEERQRLLLAEAAAANAKFRAMFEQATLFAGILNLEGVLLECNRLSCEGCGFPREQALDKPFWEGPWWAPAVELSDRIKEATSQAAAGRLFRAEMPYFVADGCARMVDINIFPIKDDSGRILFLAATGADITDRKLAEADRQKFVTLVENSTDLIGICDLQGSPFYLNRAGLELVGLDSIEQVRRASVREFFFPEDQSKIMEEFFPSVLKKGHGAIEIRFRHFKTGEARWMSNKVLALTDPDGQKVGFATVSQDVTERRHMEDALRKMAADLSEADRRKDEFLAILAHELRNPLAPIRNALQIFRLAPDQETKDKTRGMMERQLNQMVRLVDDLLDVSRITRGMLELRTQREQIASVVNSAVETSRPTIDHMGHELIVQLPAQPIIVDADLTRLAQVISNLLNNSAKYMDRGGRIWLKVERQGSDVLISVQDTGIGISANHLQHIFDMFSQTEQSQGRSQGGLGIGLTIVKRLVEMHGGTIEARSEGPGKGSVFIVRLPVVVGESAPRGRPEMDGPLAPKSSLRILVVDDNRDNADSLATLLSIMGNTTRTAYDGKAGVEAAEELRPEVMLLDIGLPALNGYETCERIRQQPWGRSIVMIALTGWGQEDDRRRSYEAGFDHHMVKPVDPQALLQLLASLSRA